MDKPTLADFLRRALVWPDPNSDSGWINLHWRMHDRKGITGGQAFKTHPDLMGMHYWTQTKGKGKIADVYFCTSLQEAHGDPKPNGKYSALRSINNAVSSRLLFADVDKYPTKAEMYAAIKAFCERSVSPYPTALVDSGRGLHAYWILPEPLQKDDWLELACKFDGLMNFHGLKHDNISTDMARILRVPDTLNYKRAVDGVPPVPVVLKLLNGNVDLSDWQSLHKATPTTPPPIRASANASIAIEHLFVDPTEISKGPSSFFKGKISLAEQIGEGVLDPAPILQLCPMFAETLATGGKEVGQPVWHQQALACTFLTGGGPLFHKLGCQHVGYTPESSHEMYDRKIRDRAVKGLGYPSCRQFEADGAIQCSGCSLKGKITSPLNIVASMLPQSDTDWADSHFDEIVPPDYRLPLPENCRYDDEGFIVTEVGSGKYKTWERVFESRFTGAATFIDPHTNGVGLHVWITNGRLERQITIPAKAFGGNATSDITTALNDGGCSVMGHNVIGAKVMLTFRARLQRERDLRRSVPYGWEYAERAEGQDQGHAIGFAYGGKVYEAEGKVRDNYSSDAALDDTYCVNGSPNAWVQAVRAILRMCSPGLQVTVLAAFAAPLMVFTGQPCTVVMVRGQSGGSKTTASAVACAVWARPRTAMLKPSSSKLAAMRRMGRVRHLPTIWDDIRNDQFDVVKDTLMEITQGGEGLKLNQNREEREQGIWDNMLLTTSNNSLVEYLEGISKNDGAALVRCFEFEVPRIKHGDDAYEDPIALSSLISSLDSNHGHAGREYAMILGADPVGLQKMYTQVAEQFMRRIEPFSPHERYWLAAAASIIMGAHLANSLPILKSNGVRFSVDDIKEFLFKTFMELRERHANANFHADTSRFAKHHLNAFINGWAAPRNEAVWTADAPSKAGRPDATLPVWPTGDMMRHQKVVSLRWIISDKKVRISRGALERFLTEQKVSTDRMREGLVRYYGARLVRTRIASGLPNISAQGLEPIYEIEIKPGSWLDDILLQHATDDDLQRIGPKPPEQTPRQPSSHPQPEQTAPADAKDASST